MVRTVLPPQIDGGIRVVELLPNRIRNRGVIVEVQRERGIGDQLDAAVCGLLVLLVSVIVIESALQWISVISGRRQAATQESPFVPTAYAEETI